MKLIFAAVLAALTTVSTTALASPPSMADRLTIHEWGTFTVLQDEHGRAIGGINTDDEPVPAFVHSVNAGVVQSLSDLPPVYFKAVPQCDPSITVRLETPVIYFHAPSGYDHAIDLDVAFHGGWLTQFYPDAKVTAPGLTNNYQSGMLTEKTVGTLSWHNLQLGCNSKGPQTNDPVWVAPRRVDANSIQSSSAESERFIFYRGVGHIGTPLVVSRTRDGKLLEVRADFGNDSSSEQSIGPLWLVDVRPDGKRAVRIIQQLAVAHLDSDAAPRIPAEFSQDEYGSDLRTLRRSMHAALVAQGLYGDEADALLNTWEVSYFNRPGLRLFYLVPREWTDRTLPMELRESGRVGEPLMANVRRVMVGRVELVTPSQRHQLDQIARGPASDARWLYDALRTLGNTHADGYREEWLKKLTDGKESLAGLHMNVPADYRAYLELGRFRNALILDEASRTPTPALRTFIDNYGLRPS